MAWVLKFDGSDDYASHAGFSIGSGDDFSLRIKASSASASVHTRWIGGASTAASAPRTFYFATSGNIRLATDGANRDWNVGVDVTILQELEFRRTSGQLDFYVAGVLQTGGFSSNTDTFTNSSFFGVNFGTVTGEGQLEYIELDINATPVNAWDATASSHGSGTPVLTDTIGGIDATGVNMPTDGSAWLDLGGSGITVTATLGAINYASQDTTVQLSGEIDVVATLGLISYSSQDATVQLTGDIGVIATLGAINYTSQDTAIQLSGEIDLSATLGLINYSSNDVTIGITGGISVNATLGTIDYTSQNTTVTLEGEIVIPVTLGTITYDSNNVIVGIGEGQIIGVVTAGFADDLFSSSFKPDQITVTFKT